MFEKKSKNFFVLSPESLKKLNLKDIDEKMKKRGAPVWLKLDKAKKEGEIIGMPAAASA